MNLVDANVLMYAVNEAEPRHEEASAWLDAELSAGRTVGFAWVVVLAFVRLTTKAGLFPRPLSTEDALSIVQGWLDASSVVVVEPTPDHLGVLSNLLRATGSGGNLTIDAHLGALALEHRAVVCTYDSDFGRFPGVRWAPPAASGS